MVPSMDVRNGTHAYDRYSGNAPLTQYSESMSVTSESSLSSRVDGAAQAVFDEIRNRAKSHMDRHFKAPLQDAARAGTQLLLREYADQLLTSDGLFDLDALDALIESFEINPPGIATTRHTVAVLRELRDNPELRASIESLELPGPDGLGRTLIRSSLHMGPAEMVNERHARHALLFGLLCYLRQGHAGSCFATNLAIELQRNHTRLVIRDLKQILTHSRLERERGGMQKEYPFLTSMTHERGAVMVPTVNSLGQCVNLDPKMSPPWESPGLVEACRQLGFDNVEKAIKTCMISLSEGAAPRLYGKGGIDVISLLKELAMLAAAEHGMPKQEIPRLFQMAVMGFETETQNPLLRAWESAIAGMAEAGGHHSRKDWIISCIMTAMGKASLPQAAKDANIMERFNVALNKRMRYMYDPIMENIKQRTDGHSTHGGFHLYDNNGHEDSTRWSRVTTSDHFNHLLRSIVVSVCDDPATRAALLSHVRSDTFSRALYGEMGLKVLGPITDQTIKQMRVTPWRIEGGAHTTRVLLEYFGCDEIPGEQTMQIRNAGDILRLISQSYHSTGRPLALAVLGIHGFTPTAACDSLPEPEHMQNWLEDNVINPGRRLASEPISTETRREVLKALGEGVLARDPSFSFTASMIPNGSIAEFRNALVQLVHGRRGWMSEPISPAEMTRAIDRAIVDALPDDQRERLYASSFVFADTNWHAGQRDIHFCVMVNPGTGQLEVWQVFDNGDGFIPLEQSEWVINSRWVALPSFESVLAAGSKSAQERAKQLASEVLAA